MDLTIKTFIEDMITQKLKLNSDFSIDKFNTALNSETKPEFTDINSVNWYELVEYHKEDLAQNTRVFIYVCSLAHIVFNFIIEGQYDKSKIDNHPLFKYWKELVRYIINNQNKNFASTFYDNLQEIYEVYSIPGFNMDYFKRLLIANKHMQLNVMKYKFLHFYLYPESSDLTLINYKFNEIKGINKKATIDNHLNKLSLLKCQEDDKDKIKDKIDVNCVKEFLKNNKSFFDTKVYKFFKDETIFVK